VANNITVKDAAAASVVVKTTDNASVHTPHHNVDSSALPTGAATSAKQDTEITHLATLAGAVGGTEVQVDVLTLPNVVLASGTVTAVTSLTNALPAGTNNIGDVDVLTIAAGDNNIGNVDVASIAAGDNNIGNVDIVSGTLTTVSTVTTVTAVTAITNALPAGTNAIGKLAANSGVDIGDVDVTSLPALVAGTAAIGKLLPPDVDVTAHTNYAKKYYTSAGAATDGIIWSPAAGKRWHITTITIQVSAAATVTLEDDKAGGDEAIYKAEFAANGGIVLTFPEMYPWASGEDAADLIITTSAGNVYVTAVGYEV
jgi:ethanolamine utilization microcompartment shell protein EutS